MLYILLIILIGVIASKRLRMLVRGLIDSIPVLFMLALVCAGVGLLIFGIAVGLKAFANAHSQIFALSIDFVLFGLFCLLMRFLESKFIKKFGEKNTEKIFSAIGHLATEFLFLFVYTMLVWCFYPVWKSIPSNWTDLIFPGIFVVYLSIKYFMVPRLRKI